MPMVATKIPNCSLMSPKNLFLTVRTTFRLTNTSCSLAGRNLFRNNKIVYKQGEKKEE